MLLTWMSHGAPMNESCHSYEYVMQNFTYTHTHTHT